MAFFSPSTGVCGRCASLALLAATAFLGLSGCATTAASPQARARTREAAFRGLPARDRTLALAGKVRSGMSQDAVYVAWGQPTQVFQGKAGERRLLVWAYLQASPARPSLDFGNYPADYLVARADFEGVYHHGNQFSNEPGAFASRFYPRAVFYPGPLPGSVAAGQPVLDREAVFENGRLVRHVTRQASEEER